MSEARKFDRQLEDKQAWLKPFAKYYSGARFAGADVIIRRFLDLPDDFVLPITVPHGVDTHALSKLLDLERIEPIYLATREDIARTAAATKPALRFPDPWLMLPPTLERHRPHGTLFVAPPSSKANNEAFYQAVCRVDLPKPWKISLKHRGLDQGDADWWRERGFDPQSAGAVESPDFFVNQRQMICESEMLCISYPTSMAVFAAQLGRRVIAVPEVEMLFIGDEVSLPYYNLKDRGPAQSTWKALLSEDKAVAKREALELLGTRFMAKPDELRGRLFEVIRSLKEPIHLSGRVSGTSHRLITAALRQGFPAHKLLPNPVAAGIRKVRHQLRLDRLYLIRARLFAHYGIMGDPEDSLEIEGRWSFDLGGRPGLGDGPKRLRNTGLRAAGRSAT